MKLSVGISCWRHFAGPRFQHGENEPPASGTDRERCHLRCPPIPMPTPCCRASPAPPAIAGSAPARTIDHVRAGGDASVSARRLRLHAHPAVRRRRPADPGGAGSPEDGWAAGRPGTSLGAGRLEAVSNDGGDLGAARAVGSTAELAVGGELSRLRPKMALAQLGAGSPLQALRASMSWRKRP
jgi:hypothetical protein